METTALLPSKTTTTATMTTISNEGSTSRCWMIELRLFFELAIPIMILYGSFVVSPILTSSIVGRKLGTTYLSAFALSGMTANLCTFSIVAGLFSAADTLMPQSFGIKNYKEI